MDGRLNLFGITIGGGDMFIEEFLLQLPGKVLGSLLSTAFLAALAMTSRSIRNALFYTRHESGFDYTSSWQSCAWDIQWEGFRVTIEAEGVHNDYIEKVTIKKNHENPGLESSYKLKLSKFGHYNSNRIAFYALYLRARSRMIGSTDCFSSIGVGGGSRCGHTATPCLVEPL